MKMRLSVNQVTVIVILAVPHVQTLKSVWSIQEAPQTNFGVSSRMAKIVGKEATVCRLTVILLMIGAGMTVVVQTLLTVLKKTKSAFMAPVLLWRAAMLMARAKMAGIV
jgi:hypothetical protein